MNVHLVDGTYELFRHYFALPKARDAQGREVGAVRGVLASLLAMMRERSWYEGAYALDALRRIQPGVR